MLSNASSQVEPQNTMASFTNFLPDTIELDGSWGVAFVEVSYPGICYNIEGGLMTFHYDEACLRPSNQQFLILWTNLRIVLQIHSKKHNIPKT